MPLLLRDGHAATDKPVMPSAYWGDLQIWDARVNNYNMMIDRKGREWLTASVRVESPASLALFCAHQGQCANSERGRRTSGSSIAPHTNRAPSSRSKSL